MNRVNERVPFLVIKPDARTPPHQEPQHQLVISSTESQGEWMTLPNVQEQDAKEAPHKAMRATPSRQLEACHEGQVMRQDF